MKVAIVHDWLVNYGGAEDVVAAILELYPEADIFTLVYDKKKMGSHFSKNKIYTSHLQKIPFATRIYTKLLNFMPKAFEEFDFSDYDLVICSSSSCAKGVITPPTVPHIAYVHTPMRYAWDLFYDYKKRSGRLTRHFMNKWMPAIRQWDFISSQRIDSICANSNYISRRIKKFWNRESTVIYPPVNTDFYSYNPNVKREDFYVFFSRLVPYKRADIAIQACIKSGKKLIVIGGGSQLKELKKLAAKNPLVEFTGRISDVKVRDYLQRCKALLFCAEEDFGIIPVQAQSCGCPVIAYGKGGARETVIENKTGLFFGEQNVESLVKAMEHFEKVKSAGTFDPAVIAEHAQKFSRSRFSKEFKDFCQKAIKTLESYGNTSNQRTLTQSVGVLNPPRE